MKHVASLAMLVACSRDPQHAASTPPAPPDTWEFGWAPASLKMIVTTPASVGMTLRLLAERPEPCLASIRKGISVEATIIAPKSGKGVFAFYGAFDRSQIEACARSLDGIAVASSGAITSIDSSRSDNGPTIDLWFAARSWVIAGRHADIDDLRAGPRLSQDSVLARLYRQLEDCGGVCQATTYPIADRIIGVPSNGFTMEGGLPKARIRIAYASAEDAKRALDRLHGRQLDAMVPPRFAEAIAATPTRLDGAAVVLNVDFDAAPWSAFSVDDGAALTREIQAKLASDPAFPGLR